MAGRRPLNQVAARDLDAVAAALRAVLPSGAVQRDASLAPFTTYHLGGPAAVLVRLTAVGDVAAVADVIAEHHPGVLVVGRGSNLLVADAGYEGVAMVLAGEFEHLGIDEPGDVVHAGAAVPLPVLARRSAARGRGGLEFFVGIPGSVGGAVRMNAGGHGRETADVLAHADVADLERGGVPVRRAAATLGLGYRRSSLAPSELVVSAGFTTRPVPADECEATLAEIVRWRREHQPGGSNAGSVFANPPGDSAGRLIDAIGLKGLRVGGAVVSAKHANFFQAEEGATADDVHALVRLVRERVLAETGVDLHPELRMVGFEASGG